MFRLGVEGKEACAPGHRLKKGSERWPEDAGPGHLGETRNASAKTWEYS